jgi:hypothetical protein
MENRHSHKLNNMEQPNNIAEALKNVDQTM